MNSNYLVLLCFKWKKRTHHVLNGIHFYHHLLFFTVSWEALAIICLPTNYNNYYIRLFSMVYLFSSNFHHFPRKNDHFQINFLFVCLICCGCCCIQFFFLNSVCFIYHPLLFWCSVYHHHHQHLILYELDSDRPFLYVFIFHFIILLLFTVAMLNLR